MNKEEIEESKKCLNETIQNTYAEGKAIKLDNLRKYIEYLESKLDKVTDKLKDFKKLLKEDGVYGYDKEINSILNITKGEKK